MAAGIIVLIPAAIAIELGDAFGVKASHMLRDPSTVYDTPWYGGAISFFGIAVMLVTAGIAIFAGILGTTARGLMIAVGCFSALLALDDQFLLHETVLPRHAGLSETTVVAIYALMGLGILIALIRRSGFHSLLALTPALFFLALSLAADLMPGDERASYTVEDLSKLAGFGGWAGFWIAYCAQGLRGARRAPRPSSVAAD